MLPTFIIGVFSLKFKYLIIAFSGLAVIILLIAVFLPLLLSKGITVMDFRHIILPLFAFIVLLLIGVSIFFFLNYRLLSLLEREDWPALAYYLEQKVYGKKRFTDRNVRLLASSYMVISDFQSVSKLEGKTMHAKPLLVYKNALIFGSAKVLSGKYGEAAFFFLSNINKCNKKDKQWVRWFSGFSHLLGGAFSSAEPEFSSLAVSSNDAIITGLSSYFLFHSIEKSSSRQAECRHMSENGRDRVMNSLKNISEWNKEVEKLGTNIHAAIIRKYIDAAGTWLFDPDAFVEKVPEPVVEAQERRSGDRRKGERRASSRYSEDRRKGDRRIPGDISPKDDL